MAEVGIRALQQNASAVVAEAGLATPAEGSLADLPPPEPRPSDGPTLTDVLLAMREDERY